MTINQSSMKSPYYCFTSGYWYSPIYHPSFCYSLPNNKDLEGAIFRLKKKSHNLMCLVLSAHFLYNMLQLAIISYAEHVEINLSLKNRQ